MKFIKYIFISLIALAQFNSYAVVAKILITPATLEVKEFFDKFNAYGECRNEKGRNYHAQVDGTVDFLLVKQGDSIKAGEVIIAINKDVAEAIKSQGEAGFRAAELSYNKDKSLFAKKLISRDVMEKSRVNFEEAKVKLAQSLKTYNEMVITAPYDSDIGVIKVLIGDKVKPHDYLFSLISNSNSSIFLELPETLHNKISTSTEVVLTDSNGSEMEGFVSSTSPYLSNHGTITTKVMTKHGKCIHGSYINAMLVINKHKGLAMPEQSVLQNDQGSFVYKIGVNNVIEQLYIKTGMRTGGMIEILSDNLFVGDNVVLEGLTRVQDGSMVDTLNPSVAPNL